jgi:uncharacterized repeat protein (TIGR01451 family)
VAAGLAATLATLAGCAIDNTSGAGLNTGTLPQGRQWQTNTDGGYADAGAWDRGASEGSGGGAGSGAAADTGAAAGGSGGGSSGGSWGASAPAGGPGMVTTGLAFPTGDERTSAVMLHQVMPREVTLGSPFDYEYHVTNLTNGTLQNVIVSLESASNLSIVGSDPQGSAGGSGAFWNLGELAPRETKVIRVRASAQQIGTASNCVTVSYNNTLCAATNVVQPALAVTKQAITPRGNGEAMLCDSIQYVFEVRNTGTGLARNVRLQDTLPDGIVTNDGQTALDVALGDLASGEGKKVTINAKANRTGRFDNTANAVADGGLTATSGNAPVVITQPQLTLASDCTGTSFIGRNFTHNYTVRNTGDGVCENATVCITIPSGTSVVRMTGNGTQTGNQVCFNVGNLAPGAEAVVGVTLSSGGPGAFTSTASANCGCAEPATSTCTTNVTGIPAVLLEVIDIEDPIEVGNNETYVITVTNQGSAQDTNIAIRATLAAEQEFVSASGATAHSVSGKSVAFAPLATLAPKARAEWRVTVKAIAAGDVRFAVQMDTDQLTSPVNETEATNQYQ